MRPEPGAWRAEPIRLTPPRGQVRLDASLDVHVFPDRKPFGQRQHIVQLAAEVPGDLERKLGRPGVLGQRLRSYLEQQAQAPRQAPEVLIVRWRREIGGAHAVNNARGRKRCQGI